jgi:hypothetical protein
MMHIAYVALLTIPVLKPTLYVMTVSGKAIYFVSRRMRLLPKCPIFCLPNVVKNE